MNQIQIKENIRHNLIFLRKLNRYTQQKISKIVGLKTRVAYQAYENGNAKNANAVPSYETLIKLADVHEVRVIDLLKKKFDEESYLVGKVNRKMEDSI